MFPGTPEAALGHEQDQAVRQIQRYDLRDFPIDPIGGTNKYRNELGAFCPFHDRTLPFPFAKRLACGALLRDFLIWCPDCDKPAKMHEIPGESQFKRVVQQPREGQNETPPAFGVVGKGSQEKNWRSSINGQERVGVSLEITPRSK